MNSCILEVCVDSVESAVIADAAGATRVELCSNLVIGGTTPSPALTSLVKKNSACDIYALIRPRFGDFCYTPYELDMIKEDIRVLSSIGITGVVIGALTSDGDLDLNAMESFIDAANGLSITLHRAFDVCRNYKSALEEACKLGVNTILTSGQSANALKGSNVLRDLAQTKEVLDGKINIMAGGGVNSNSITSIYEKTGIKMFHMSGKELIESKMTYRNEFVSMGLKELSEFEIIRTNQEEIERALNVLKELSKK
ncbi:MAG: copper homeostasis protein CutC [Lachnospiraceae bacterium]